MQSLALGVKVRYVSSLLRVLHGLDQSRQRVFRVAIKHARYRLKKQRVLKTGKTFALAALQDYY